jgi:hypothetical protein
MWKEDIVAQNISEPITSNMLSKDSLCKLQFIVAATANRTVT